MRSRHGSLPPLSLSASADCAHGDYGTGPESYCTYQPEIVRWLFIFFQCGFPGLLALLAAWPTYFYPLEREAHAQVTEGIAAHKRGESAVDPLTGT